MFTLTNYILKHKNNVSKKKKKTLEAGHFLKVSNKDTTGIIESCSLSKYVASFGRILIPCSKCHQLSCLLAPLFAYETHMSFICI